MMPKNCIGVRVRSTKFAEPRSCVDGSRDFRSVNPSASIEWPVGGADPHYASSAIAHPASAPAQWSDGAARGRGDGANQRAPSAAEEAKT